MIVILTETFDPHADLVVEALRDRSVSFYRLNLNTSGVHWNILVEFNDNKFIYSIYDKNFKREMFNSDTIHSLYIRRPKLPPFYEIKEIDDVTPLKEEFRAFYRGFLQTLNCYTISPFEDIILAERKIYQLKKAIESGFFIPKTIITNQRESQCNPPWNGQSIIKGLDASDFSKDGDHYFIPTTLFNIDLVPEVESVAHFWTPTLIQQKIDKKFEVRLIFISGEILSFKIDSQSVKGAELDWRQVPYTQFNWQLIETPENICTSCKKYSKLMNLRFGAFDFIVTNDGRWIFLECNPNGQWGWLQNVDGIDIAGKIADALINKKEFEI